MDFQIKCAGRKAPGVPALSVPVDAIVHITQRANSNTISSDVACVYNTGGHGQRCKASHSDQDKVGEGVLCPYSLDVPYYSDGALVKPY